MMFTVRNCVKHEKSERPEMFTTRMNKWYGKCTVSTGCPSRLGSEQDNLTKLDQYTHRSAFSLAACYTYSNSASVLVQLWVSGIQGKREWERNTGMRTCKIVVIHWILH